jgi:hypothetical protein
LVLPGGSENGATDAPSAAPLAGPEDGGE